MRCHNEWSRSMMLLALIAGCSTDRAANREAPTAPSAGAKLGQREVSCVSAGPLRVRESGEPRADTRGAASACPPGSRAPEQTHDEQVDGARGTNAEDARPEAGTKAARRRRAEEAARRWKGRPGGGYARRQPPRSEDSSRTTSQPVHASNASSP